MTAVATVRVPRRQALIWAAVLVLTVLVGASVWLATRSSAPTASGVSSSTPGDGRLAPAFSLPSVHAGAPAVSLADAAGRPAVLSFFASWCTGCATELRTMGRVQTMAGAGAGAGIGIIGIDVNDADGPARALLARDHLAYPVAADTAGSTIGDYDLAGLPTTVFLDARHRIVGRVLGPLTPALAASWLARLRATTPGS